MSDIKDIAGKHIESAKSLEASSIKYILGFSLIVLFCWYFSETAFTKTKYQIIRLNRLEQKIDSFKAYNGRLSKEQQAAYKSLKETIRIVDSITVEKYKKDVEENVPSGFKFLLRQATQRPYGILLTSITVLTFLLYLFNLRRSYLARLGVALRIIKDSGGYNEIFDYNLRLPFWSLPIPNNSINGVEKKNLITIGGLNRKSTFSFYKMLLLVSLLVFIQYRLYYISLITNSFLLSWILILQSIILGVSFLFALLWLLPISIRDTYNHEVYVNQNSRRDFIISSSLLLVGIGLGVFSRAISTSIIRKILKPRFVLNKKIKKPSNCHKIELSALAEINKKNFEKAADILFTEINRLKSMQHYIRLFDLIILLCLKNSRIYQKYFHDTIEIAKRSSVEKLKQQSQTWSKLTVEKIKRQKERKYWNNIEI